MNRPKIYPTRTPYKFNVTTDVLYNHMQGQMYLASACCYSLSKDRKIQILGGRCGLFICQ